MDEVLRNESEEGTKHGKSWAYGKEEPLNCPSLSGSTRNPATAISIRSTKLAIFT